MLTRIEHVALAVSDLDAAIRHYRDVWGVEVARRERVHDQGVEEALLPLAGSNLQLLRPLAAGTHVGRYLERRGEGLHHIACEVEDLEEALAELRAKGVRLIDDEPRRGGSGHAVAFVHPHSNHGVLIELIQAPRSSR